MAPKPLPSDLPILAFPSAQTFESFLAREHATSPGIHLKLARKKSGIPSVSPNEALEVALCYGWINGQGNQCDDDFYLARYTPRRPNSMWSKINVDLISKLAEEGRMRPAGIAAVEAAKSDGRWQRAYASPTNMEVPDDFAAALANNETAAAFFDTLSRTARYSVLWRVHTVSPSVRAKRIETLVESLAKRETPRDLSGKTKQADAGKTKQADAVSKSQNSPAIGQSGAAQKRKDQNDSAEEFKAKQPRRPGLRTRP